MKSSFDVKQLRGAFEAFRAEKKLFCYQRDSEIMFVLFEKGNCCVYGVELCLAYFSVESSFPT